MKKFEDYYNGYVGSDDKPRPGYVEMIEELETKYPLSEPQIIGEQNQKEFIMLFGSILRMRNLLSSFDEFKGKELIENFIGSLNEVENVMGEWQTYVAEERERELAQIIREENLKEPETRKFVENAFRDGEVKTTGTDIDKLMPPVSRFGGGRAKKKQTVIDKLKVFFKRFFGIGGTFKAKPESNPRKGNGD